MPKGVYSRPTLVERFWPKVDQTGGPDACWPWTRSLFRRGLPYGQFQWRGRPHVAHRIAWMLTNGEIPEGMKVCHRCDNPPCCNPSHLFLGDQSANERDKVAKGRWNGYRGGRKPRLTASP